MKLNDREHKVLTFFAKRYDEDSSFYYFRAVRRTTRLKLAEVRRACRSLKKKGFVMFERGLIRESDGMLAGSGYSCTQAGYDFIQAEKRAKEAQRVQMRLKL